MSTSTSITTISDTHNQHDAIDVGSGDLIIHAGDATSRGKEYEIQRFLMWYGKQDYECKIFVPGNHDFGFESYPQLYADMCDLYGVTLLNDSGHTYRGIKIWGSPVQPEFHGWAFNRSATAIAPHWAMIPDDTDILVTHGPPRGILDLAHGYNPAGCPLLLKRVQEVKPKLHVFGHVHESRGMLRRDGTVYVNAACLDRRYEPYPERPFQVHISLDTGIVVV